VCRTPVTARKRTVRASAFACSGDENLDLARARRQGSNHVNDFNSLFGGSNVGQGSGSDFAHTKSEAAPSRMQERSGRRRSRRHGDE